MPKLASLIFLYALLPSAAPKVSAQAERTLSDTGDYRLDGADAGVRASGLDVLNFSLTRRVRRRVDFNFAIDNLTNKRYFETQNYFESRLRPGGAERAPINGRPGYRFGLTIGLTFRFSGKG